MKISTKGRYALRLMLDLAKNQGSGYVSLKDVSERQNISRKYLEQIVPLLTRADILHTARGFQGGYRLTKEPARYTVAEILRLTEGNLAPIACLEPSAPICQRRADCEMLPIWQGLQRVINDYLDGITLQDILNRQTSGRVVR